MLPFVLVGGIGLITGSFLNALLFRFNTGKSVMRGRSACMRCGHKLAMLDLIPLVSYLGLGGKCRYCHARISWQYPLVELAAAALAVGVYLTTPEPLWFSFWFVVWMVLLFIVVYDLRHKIIPWSATLALMALSLAGIALNAMDMWGYGVGQEFLAQALLAGPILAAPLLLISLMSRGTWMGWGDGILELSLGWLLGLSAGFTALLMAFWTGAVVGVALLATKKRYTMSSEVPFAPFLILGVAAAYFLHADLFAFSFVW